MLIDSHCHLDRLDLAPYAGDFSRFMQTTQAAGVMHMLCVGINLERYPAMRRLADEYSSISVSVGVHPNETDGQSVDVDTLVRLAADEKVVAIGETGLDYFYGQAGCAEQQSRFRCHIQAALQIGKPLIIHSRSAKQDTLRILREEHAERIGGVFHCFTEDWDTAQQALDLNFQVSFSGVVTFKNAALIQEVARRIPENAFLIETDSPYLAPIPHRGKPNYPHYVRHVAECIAQLRQTDWQTIAALSSANYQRLFGQVSH